MLLNKSNHYGNIKNNPTSYKRHEEYQANHPRDGGGVGGEDAQEPECGAGGTAVCDQCAKFAPQLETECFHCECSRIYAHGRKKDAEGRTQNKRGKENDAGEHSQWKHSVSSCG